MGPDTDLLLELRGLATLGALLLLPGLLVVRAPWTGVPFLSASFWILSWWWLSPVSPERERFLLLTLAGFSLVLVLRLFKPLALRWPGWPVLLVAAAALARLVPVALWPVAPGEASSRQAMLTLLLAWHDGIPNSYEPLLRVLAHGTPACGLAGLAADVTLLSGLPAHRSALLVSCAALGLLQVALFALLERFFPGPVAAAAAVLALALAKLPQGLPSLGASDALLALALLTAAAAVLARATSRSRAVAAGWILAAALATDPGGGVIAALGCGLLVLGRRPGHGQRMLVGALALLVCVAPFAGRMRGWSLAATGDASLGAIYLLACAVGLARALRERWRDTAAAVALGGLLLGLGEQGNKPLWSAAAAVILCGGLAHLLVGTWALRPAWRALVMAVLIGAAAQRVVVSYAQAGTAIGVGPDELRAFEFLAGHTGPLEVVCSQPGAGSWIPAIAGRGSSTAVLDALERPTFEPRRCSYSFVRMPAQDPVFAVGSVAIVRERTE